jgi:Fe-S oxidoreductase
VKEFGGSLSGEHGDGRARSPFMERFYGPEIYGAFREIKRTFDPKGLLNPGLIVDAEPVDTHLRYGAGYPTPEFETVFDFSKDGGMLRAAELCSGVGHCRKRTEGTMCPSYMATMEEQHTTRARGNALRLAITGQLGAEGLTSEEVKQALDLCLECKACKTECPSFVDMAKLKYEFLYQYHKKHGTPLRDRMFAHIEGLMKLASLTAPLSNWIARMGPSKFFMEKLFGIDRRRGLPPFARKTFVSWFKAQGGRVGEIPENADPKRSAILFHDTFLNYGEPNIGEGRL